VDGGRGGRARLRVAAPDGPGSRLALARIGADFASIGVQIERVDEGQPADLRLVDTVARYTRAAWFLNHGLPGKPRRMQPGGDAGRAGTAERDPQARMALLAQAERAVTAANGFIPIARPCAGRWCAAA
jgi:peptide/nickel transport system substrate-binding protein/oligopeptide transport system substrate-binding protein